MVNIIFPNGTKLGDYLALSGGVMTGPLKMSEDLYPTLTDVYQLGTVSKFWTVVWSQSYYVDDQYTYLMNNVGNMKFVVATGKKFEFVVA